MSDTTAVSYIRHQSLARLALILALLSVPGSTVAWALPAGGFWIGAPLAVAAIVVGRRARADGDGAGMATAAIAIAGSMLAFMLVWTLAGAVS